MIACRNLMHSNTRRHRSSLPRLFRAMPWTSVGLTAAKPCSAVLGAAALNDFAKGA